MIQEPTTVIIADDHEMVIDGLGNMLGKMKQVSLIGTAPNGEELVKLVFEKQPQIVLTDVKMKGMNGIQATRAIKAKLPETKVLGLSAYEELSLVNDMMDAGANGFLLKNVGPPELQRAFEAVLLDEDFFSPDIAHMMYNAKLPMFTKREEEVMIMIAQEKSSKEIADQLFISTRTVEKHRQNLQKKIGTNSAVGIAVYATKNGYV